MFWALKLKSIVIRGRAKTGELNTASPEDTHRAYTKSAVQLQQSFVLFIVSASKTPLLKHVEQACLSTLEPLNKRYFRVIVNIH
jgi:hypothetical protein